MDEPFSAIDAINRMELQKYLVDAWLAEPRTVIYVTHDIDEAVYLADRVLVLSGTPGRIVASVDVALPRPREQTETRSSPQFLSLRNELHALIALRESVQSRAQ
jgi:NitT/TauT family transport system ATP-binding protein